MNLCSTLTPTWARSANRKSVMLCHRFAWRQRRPRVSGWDTKHCYLLQWLTWKWKSSRQAHLETAPLAVSNRRFRPGSLKAWGRARWRSWWNRRVPLGACQKQLLSVISLAWAEAVSPELVQITSSVLFHLIVLDVFEVNDTFASRRRRQSVRFGISAQERRGIKTNHSDQ